MRASHGRKASQELTRNAMQGTPSIKPVRRPEDEAPHRVEPLRSTLAKHYFANAPRNAAFAWLTAPRAAGVLASAFSITKS